MPSNYIKQSVVRNEVERVRAQAKYASTLKDKLQVLGSYRTLANLGLTYAGEVSEYAQENNLEDYYYEEEKL